MAENEKIKEAVEELTGMSKDEELRILAELREKGRRDEYARRQYAIKQGLQEGRKQGIKENKIEIAKNMIRLGIDKEIIAKSTGLKIEEIEKLR